jgi:hypothetical protein
MEEDFKKELAEPKKLESGDVAVENKPIEIKEEISKEELDEAIPVLKKFGLVKSSKVSFSGPLPPQVLNKLTSEQVGFLVSNHIRHSDAKDKMQERMVNAMEKDSKDERLQRTIRYFGLGIFFLIVFLTCIFTNNVSFIKDYTPILVAAGGGAGVGIYIRGKKDEGKGDKIELE